MDPSWVLAGGYEGGEGGESIERVLTIGPDISHITANPTGRTSSPPYYPDLLWTGEQIKTSSCFCPGIELARPALYNLACHTPEGWVYASCVSDGNNNLRLSRENEQLAKHLDFYSWNLICLFPWWREGKEESEEWHVWSFFISTSSPASL